MPLDLTFLEESMPGTTVPRPLSGTLSGHAAGEPFDKHVCSLISKEYPGRTYRHYELLNAALHAAGTARTTEERRAALGSRALQRLLSRGEAAMKGWTPEQVFEEKQDDTADIVVLKGDP